MEYMKNNTLKLICILCLPIVFLSCQVIKEDAPNPIYPVPTAAQMDWHKMETYAFFHFSMNTFNDKEWGYGDTPAGTFNPTSGTIDCDQWVKLCKDAGMKGVILTAKHHDGFCLWPSKYTEYSVKNSKWKDGKGDMVRDLSDACKKYGLKFGLYLSPWDRNHAKYGKEEYVAYFHNQIDELISNYGDLFEYWFDGANGGDGYYGGAKETRSIDAKTYYKYEQAVDMIKAKHPDIMIFGGTKPDIRWVGNESGWAGQTSWATINSTDVKNDYIKYLSEGDRDGQYWLPSECDVSIRPGWFYHESQDNSVKSVDKLVNLYYESVGRNSNFLLNLTPAKNGRILPLDSMRLLEYHRAITMQLKNNLIAGADAKASNTRRGYRPSYVTDGDYDTYWATEDGVNQADIIISLPDSAIVNRLLIQEYIPLGQRIEAFEVEIGNNGIFTPVKIDEKTTTVGYKRILRFESVSGDQLKIRFTKSKGELCINNIEVFNAPQIITAPKIRRDANDVVTITSPSDVDMYYTMDGSVK